MQISTRYSFLESQHSHNYSATWLSREYAKLCKTNRHTHTHIQLQRIHITRSVKIVLYNSNWWHNRANSAVVSLFRRHQQQIIAVSQKLFHATNFMAAIFGAKSTQIKFAYLSAKTNYEFLYEFTQHLHLKSCAFARSACH